MSSEIEATKGNNKSDGISVTCSCVLISFVAISLAIVSFIGFGMNRDDMTREILNGKASDTYCNQYVLSKLFASFDCSGQVNECNNDVNCYTPGNIFGHDYCQDECVCCLAQSVVDNNANLDKQASSIGTTFIVSIVFASLHVLFLIYEILVRNNRMIFSLNILIQIGLLVVLISMIINITIKWVRECIIAAIVFNSIAILYAIYIWLVTRSGTNKVNTRINVNTHETMGLTTINNDAIMSSDNNNSNNNNNKKNFGEIWNYLKNIGFLEYYELFIQNGYQNKNDLMSLTDNDLMTIGITKHLHRKKILNAINGNNNDELPGYTAQ